MVNHCFQVGALVRCIIMIGWNIIIISGIFSNMYVSVGDSIKLGTVSGYG